MHDEYEIKFLREAFTKKLKEVSPEVFLIHNCGMCKYPCGFFYTYDACPTCEKRDHYLFYDSGCDCVRGPSNHRFCNDKELDPLFKPENGYLPRIRAWVHE